MTKTLQKNAYAKINLFLDVKDKRPDGYHDIESVMQTVTLCDIVSVTRNDEDDARVITVTCTDPKVPTDSRNIVHKCAVAFFEHFGIEHYSISIHIEKRIMAEAGLAGGSTDGAATLHLLGELFDVHADTATLCEIGVKVGADLPFFQRYFGYLWDVVTKFDFGNSYMTKVPVKAELLERIPISSTRWKTGTDLPGRFATIPQPANTDSGGKTLSARVKNTPAAAQAVCPQRKTISSFWRPCALVM